MKVVRFVIRGSVEEKMLEIQARKQRLVGALTEAADVKLGVEEMMAFFD